jgi:hypothetical protein
VEDQFEVQDTGVEEVPAAEVQETEQLNHVEVNNSGVEESEVAAQNDEKGFAKALKAREEQIRQQLEREYGEKAKEAEKYQQALDRTARYYGFADHEQYMQALEQAEIDKKIQDEAARLGVDEEVIRHYVQPLNQKLSEYETKLRTIEEQEALRKVESQIASMENDAANFPDFGKHKSAVIEYAAQRGYSLEDAYKIVTYDSRVQAAALQAQQEAVRKLHQNADSSTGSLGADAPEHAGGYMSMSPAERKAFRDKVMSGQI